MIARKHLLKLFGAALFLLYFLWFCFPGEYVMIANMDQHLFYTTTDHFMSFTSRPGGILEYAGQFLTQFYRFRMAGAMVIALLITSGFFVTARLIKTIPGQKGIMVFAIMSSVLLAGMHNYYPHQVHHSLGFILVILLSGLIPVHPGKRRLFLVAAIPVIYYILGGYVWFFSAIMLARFIKADLKNSLEIVLLNLVYPAVIVFIATRFFFLDQPAELFLDPLPLDLSYPLPGLSLIFMIWILSALIFNRIYGEKISSQGSPKKTGPYLKTAISSVFLIAGTFLIFLFTYNKKNREFFTIEKLAVQENWDDLLGFVSRHPSSNLFGTYYTNLALQHKDMLCSSLFNYPQVFSTDGLCFRWDSKPEILRRGSDFFWSINFVNEAHHWSFESMVSEGFTRRNLLMLIRTELIRGNYAVVEKYIRLLRKSLFNRKLAAHYSQFIEKPEKIRKDPELGPGSGCDFNHDFFTDGADLEKNLQSLILNDPSNRPAFDYFMALLMIEKRVDDIAGYLPDYVSLHGSTLPRLLDESLLLYHLLNPDASGPDIQVSRQTIARFEDYARILRQSRDQNEAARLLFPKYGNTFWFHMNFAGTKK